MAVVTHSGTLPDDSAKTDFYSIIDGATVSGILNADCSASMGLVDTKLNQITTASKVAGTALTGLASIPVGAGVIPRNNIPTTSANGQTQITGVVSTTSNSYADISGLTVTITTTGGNVLVIMSSNVIYTNGGGTKYFQCLMDSAVSSGEGFGIDMGNYTVGVSGFQWLFTSVAAGSHDFKIQWHSATSEKLALNTIDGTNAIGSTRIIAMELM